MAKVSILIVTYNRSELLQRAVESVQKQSLQDWELIVADDDSTDVTAEVIKQLQQQDKQIKYLRAEHSGRIAIISNFGLRQATGEYIAILDDDDYWSDTEKLKKQVAFLDKHLDVVGCGGGYIVIDEKGKEQGRYLKPEQDKDIRKHALVANPMANSTTMFRRAVAEQVGFYDESLKQFADWDFWLKMGLQGKLYNFPEYFVYYQMWPNASSFKNQKENAQAAIVIVRRYWHKYPNSILAFLQSGSYWLHAHLPNTIKKISSPLLSKLKKTLFSS